MWSTDNPDPIADLKSALLKLGKPEKRRSNCFIKIPGTNLILREIPETKEQWKTLFKLSNIEEKYWIQAAKELYG